MKIQSLVYPEVNITEKVIIELLHSKPIQRLKKIYNASYNFLMGNFKDCSRYEHSVGVMLLLRMYDASIEEQIAGLLHDISHTALSHLSTYALSKSKKYDGTEFHDEIRRRFILDSDIPAILKEHKINLDYVLDEDNFSLLENNLPDICADRLDYALRDSLIYQFITKGQLDKIFSGLVVHKGSFVFNSAESASIYANAFFLCNLTLYGSAFCAYFNHDFGETVINAIDKGILKKEDWFKDDHVIINKLKSCSDKKILKQISKYDGRLVAFEDDKNPECVLSKKIRIVDPCVLRENRLQRLSAVDKCYGKKIEEYKKTHPRNELKVRTYVREIE